MGVFTSPQSIPIFFGLSVKSLRNNLVYDFSADDILLGDKEKLDWGITCDDQIDCVKGEV